jgi:hypothetical protein
MTQVGGAERAARRPADACMDIDENGIVLNTVERQTAL